MAEIITTEAHARTHRIIIDHKQVERMLAEGAANLVEFNKLEIGRPNVSYKVQLEEATEGSPPYRVGTKAVVTIIEDLLPQPAKEDL